MVEPLVFFCFYTICGYSKIYAVSMRKRDIDCVCHLGTTSNIGKPKISLILVCLTFTNWIMEFIFFQIAFVTCYNPFSLKTKLPPTKHSHCV